MTQQHEVRGVRTAVFTDNGITTVVYRGTPVVKFGYDWIELDSRGWQTATTKTRMNQASNQYDLGYQVYQKDFEWFVDHNGLTLEFFDGMRLYRRSSAQTDRINAMMRNGSTLKDAMYTIATT